MVALIGCRLEESKTPVPSPIDSDKGALVLLLRIGLLSQQTLQPPISMQIASFDIRGTGPNPLYDNFADLGNTTGQLTLKDLNPGSWAITVDARNAAGTVIGHGQTEVLISPRLVTSAQIDIQPLSGTGALSLTVQWVKGAHNRAWADCSLTSMSTGVDLAPAFTITPRKNPIKAVYNNTAIEAGYYLLTLQLYDGGGQFWGTAEAVRIVAGQTTSQTWTTN